MKALALIARAAALAFHWFPPPIMGAIYCDSTYDCRTATRAFTAVVQQRFPVGSSQDEVESALAKQGFHHLPASIKTCVSVGEGAPIGVEVIPCPPWDSNWNPRNYLKYDFSGPLPVCGSAAIVLWSADKRGRIIHIEGYYDVTCL
jgi:hypothetical protein